VIVGGFVALFLMRPRLTAAERGRRLAEEVGCFACHGPEGIRGTPNPGHHHDHGEAGDDAHADDHEADRVPTWEGDLMMFADTPGEVREWIRDGITEARRKSETRRAEREESALEMPAFGDRLSERQIDDLVAFVLAMSAPVPDDPRAAHGLERADDLGCTGCHGPGGRLSRPNRGAFKGYIPAWDGPDFPELVRDSSEFREWVERGVSRRFEGNPFASFFLRRAAVRMPAFEEHLAPGDVDALWAYVTWLRRERATPAP